MQALAERTGAAVVWRPMVLGAVFKAVGNDMPARVPHKARWMGQDLQRWADHYGVPWRMSSHFPLNTIKAMRLVLVDDAKAAAVALAGFRAMWAEDRDITEDAELRRIAELGGLDAATALAAIEKPAVKDQLRANTDEAVARGAFGAPTFFVGDELFWGNDRLHFVEAALNRFRYSIAFGAREPNPRERGCAPHRSAELGGTLPLPARLRADAAFCRGVQGRVQSICGVRQSSFAPEAGLRTLAAGQQRQQRGRRRDRRRRPATRNGP